MPSPANILMFGRDAQLLDTRRMVLEISGYKVSTATDLSDFDRAVSSDCFDLVILCHSLSLEDCGRAVAVALSRWPSVRILTLTAGAWGCPAGRLDQTVNVLQGPAKLVSTVSRFLEGVGAVSSFVSAPAMQGTHA